MLKGVINTRSEVRFRGNRKTFAHFLDPTRTWVAAFTGMHGPFRDLQLVRCEPL